MQIASKHLDELEWTAWPSDQIATRGTAQWKELLGSASGCQNDMTMGVVRLRTGESLEPHRHAQPETYFTLSGQGTVTIEGVVHAVAPGRMLSTTMSLLATIWRTSSRPSSVFMLTWT